MSRRFVRKISSYSYLSFCFSITVIFIGVRDPAFSQVSPENPEVQKLKTELDEPVFTIVEVQPEFPGGLEAKRKFFSQNLLIPKIKPELKGWVLISFIVNADGGLQDVTLFKSLYPEYDREALRVVKLMPKWIPGRQSGKRMRVKYIQSVKFP